MLPTALASFVLFAHSPRSSVHPSPARHAPRPCSYDVSPPEGPGVLASFLWADDALDLMAQGPEAVQQQVLAAWADYLGCPEVATHAINFHAVDWPSEQYVGGAFTAYMPPGVWTTFGQALNTPVGRIHWAGTENSPRWPGFYEGAVITGEEVARTVGQLLAQEA